MFPNRLGVAVVAVVTAAVLTGCGGDDADPMAAAASSAPVAATSAAAASAVPGGGDVTIDIVNYKFSQPAVTVKAGSTVTWTNKDDFEHTARAKDKSFDTKNLAKGAAGKVTFDKVGTFDYICDIHQYMAGQVTVT